MKEYTLDGAQLVTFDQAYTEIARVLGFPPYFGRNLDALEECLSDQRSDAGIIRLTIRHRRALVQSAAWPALETVFREQAVEIQLTD